MAGKKVIIASIGAFAIYLLPLKGQDKQSDGSLIGVSATLGVGALNSTSVTDYINILTQVVPKDRFDEFTSATLLSVAPEMQISDDWSLVLDYTYLIKTYSVVPGTALWSGEFDYTAHLPTLCVNYLVAGRGYWLKFGGGVGYARANLGQRIAAVGTDQSFSASGVSFKLSGSGNTQLDTNVYGVISAEMRFASGSKFADEEGTAAEYRGTRAKLSFFMVTCALGIMIVL